MIFKFFRGQFKNESGMILPMALVLLVAGAFIIVPGLSSAWTVLSVNRLYEQDCNAHYAADAGIADVYWRFKQQTVPTFPYNLSNTVNGMTVTISQVTAPVINGSTTTYTVQSTAKLNNVPLSSVSATMDVVIGDYPFQYAIATTGGNITVSGNVNSTPVNGSADIFANGNITVWGTVNGKAYATGTISPSSCSRVTGTCQGGQPAKSFQLIDESWYLAQAQAGRTYNGNWNIQQQTLTLGPVPPNTYYSYINGDLNIQQSTVTLTGVIWVNGTITISNSAVVQGQNPGSQYYLLAHGTAAQNRYISVANNTTLAANINLISDNSYITVGNNADSGSLYAPNGAVTLSGNGMVNGAIIGKSVDTGARTINYPTSLRTTPLPGFTIGASGAQVTSYSSE